MDAPPEHRITITDVRRAGYCVSGARRWFEGHPQLDFRAFLKDGLLAADFPKDAFAERVIATSLESGRGRR